MRGYDVVLWGELTEQVIGITGKDLYSPTRIYPSDYKALGRVIAPEPLEKGDFYDSVAVMAQRLAADREGLPENGVLGVAGRANISAISRESGNKWVGFSPIPFNDGSFMAFYWAPKTENPFFMKLKDDIKRVEEGKAIRESVNPTLSFP